MGGKDKLGKKGKEAEKATQKASQELKQKEDQEWEGGQRKENTKQKEKDEERERKRIEKEVLKREQDLEDQKINAKKPAYKSSIDNAMQQFGASGIDDALELLGSDKNTSKIDLHPERRLKSAYKEFEEQEIARLKTEGSVLRQSQIKQLIQKLWKKSPLNPMNQENVLHYNATKEEILQAKIALKEKTEEKFLMK
jgi:hypothetical protein